MSTDWHDRARLWLRELFPGSRTFDVRVYRERAWATNWVLTVDEGVFWFKRGHESLRQEVALLAVLQRVAPEHVLAPRAVDGEQGWILTRDQGPTLAAIARQEGPQHYCATSVALAATQQAAATSLGELQLVGLPRFDPVRAVTLLDEMLAWFHALPSTNPANVTLSVRRTATAAASALVERWVAVAKGDPGMGLDHNDLHLGNVFRGPLISDWGDAVVGHPFSSLRPVVFATGKVFGDEAATLVRTTYLKQWGDPVELRETLEVAMQLAAVQRLYAWCRLGSADLVAEYAEYVLPLVMELGRDIADLTSP